MINLLYCIIGNLSGTDFFIYENQLRLYNILQTSYEDKEYLSEMFSSLIDYPLNTDVVVH